MTTTQERAGTGTRRGQVALWGYLVAEAVSTTGTRMSMVAIPWFVLTTTGSAALTGVVGFAELLPFVLVLAVGGPVIDRWGARRVAVLSGFVAAVLVGAIPLLDELGTLPFGALLVLVALVGAVRGSSTATYVLVPGLAEAAGTPIERASGLHDGMNRVAGMVGVPLAGVLMAVWSAPVVLLLDAASFVVAAVLLWTLVPRSAEPPRSGPREDGRSAMSAYAEELRDGFRFLRGDRLLVAIGVMVLLTNMFDQAYGAVLVPVWVEQELGSPVGLGAIGGAFGVGAVLGSALFAWLGPRLPRRGSYAWGFLVGGAPRFFVLAAAVTLPPVLAVSFLAGLGVGAINPALASTEYERIPRHLQARVIGALGAVATAGMPVGALLGGVLVATIGLTPTLVVVGTTYLLTTLSPFVFPVWRQMQRPVDVEGTVEPLHRQT
ncbi:MAG: MFS transporter [Candidatus Nanopelagicales bacterium]